MENYPLTLQASLDPDLIENNFRSLFIGGPIADSDLERRIRELSRMFKVYASSCPAPFWDHGLAVTDELCRVTETYLTYSTIRRALLRLMKKSLRMDCPEPPLVSKADGWIRFLHALPLLNETPDPASLIAHLAENEPDRVRFLFSVHLPHQFGGSFDRYPRQMSFLRSWIDKKYADCRIPVPCLDAACGSGEGSYELAGALLKCGIDSSRISVTGVTLSPLEVFSAAHAFFPHDPPRQVRYREYLESVAERGTLPIINFIACDLKRWNSREKYRIIICNGILGGPLLHEHDEVAEVVRRLAGSLLSGGILCAADRFHGGWKKAYPKCEMEAIFSRCGLEIMPVGEGVAGTKK